MLAKYRYLQWVFAFLFFVVFNSFAGGWEQVSELPIWRMSAAAAAVDGKIYLIGGFDHHENLGGRAPALSTVDVYDTRTNTWHGAAKMPTPRVAPRTAVCPKEIYVFGGYERKWPRGEREYKKNVEVYNTQTDTWIKKRNMLTARYGFTTAVVNGKIYIIGGRVYDKKLGKEVTTGLVEVYDPLTNRWEKRAEMPTERGETDAVVVDGKVYVIGGYNWRNVPTLPERFVRSIEEYNPKIDKWRPLPEMPMFKGGFAAIAVDNEIYTIGGIDLENRLERIDAVDVYNPITDKWREAEPMTAPRTTTAVVVKGTIYALGGFKGAGLFSPIVEAYDTGFLAVDPKDKLLTRWGVLKKSH